MLGPLAALITPLVPQTEPPPAAEQQTVVRLSAPQATLRLRFPIADLRPERDPWAGRAVRAEQLRLELSEPQFRSELSSGPGPPVPTRLELTCSDLHGESPQRTIPRAGPQASGRGGPRATEGTETQVGWTGAQGLTSSVSCQHYLSSGSSESVQSGPFITGLLPAMGVREGAGTTMEAPGPY